MEQLTLARNAMATRFEFVLAGANGAHLRGSGEEALDEIERIEAQLSLYQPASEIAQINARAADQPVRVSAEVFSLLAAAKKYSELSGGAFDPTIGPLVRCWGFMRGAGSRPTDEQIAAARSLVGMTRVELDEAACAVRFTLPGMMLDLGSIGKGYALDRAADILRDAGVENALLHGGTSTIVALGRSPDRTAWKVALENPRAKDDPSEVIAIVELTNQSLSVSAVWGKFFEVEGKLFGHVIDPRTGWPVENSLLGAVILDTAIATDALSTAVLLGTPDELDRLARKLPEIRYLQMQTAPHAPPLLTVRGITLTSDSSAF